VKVRRRSAVILRVVVVMRSMVLRLRRCAMTVFVCCIMHMAGAVLVAVGAAGPGAHALVYGSARQHGGRGESLQRDRQHQQTCQKTFE